MKYRDQRGGPCIHVWALTNRSAVENGKCELCGNTVKTNGERVKRIALVTKATRYSQKAVPESSPLDVRNGVCWCNQCCARRGYMAGFKAAQRSTLNRGEKR
jgi:hypothetical protein